MSSILENLSCSWTYIIFVNLQLMKKCQTILPINQMRHRIKIYNFMSNENRIDWKIKGSKFRNWPFFTPFAIGQVHLRRPSWSSSYGSWIYNYLCNLCLSPLTLWVWILFMAGGTLGDKVCQHPAKGGGFSRCPPFSKTKKTYRHNIAEILLKAEVNALTINIETVRNIRNSSASYRHLGSSIDTKT